MRNVELTVDSVLFFPLALAGLVGAWLVEAGAVDGALLSRVDAEPVSGLSPGPVVGRIRRSETHVVPSQRPYHHLPQA